MDTVLQTYYRLLYEAHSASEGVDEWDLNTNDQISVIGWNKLVDESKSANLNLIRHIGENYAELLKAID